MFFTEKREAVFIPLNRLRRGLIKLLVGDSPVCMNMDISVPIEEGVCNTNECYIHANDWGDLPMYILERNTFRFEARTQVLKPRGYTDEQPQHEKK